jgi:DNA-binding MarR family transcriptional regulator
MVQLTGEGESVIRKAFTHHAAELETLFTNISQRERSTLVDLLKKLGKHVDRQLKDEMQSKREGK